MKLKFPLTAAFVAMLSLTACGGGGSDSGAPTLPPVTTPPMTTPSATNPAALIKTDIAIGTGAEAVSGKKATVTYTLWLYDGAKTEFKGKEIESNQFAFALNGKAVIAGFEQGVTGMKVGGKRLVHVPSSLAYGSDSTTKIPANSGLVFEITLNKVE